MFEGSPSDRGCWFVVAEGKGLGSGCNVRIQTVSKVCSESRAVALISPSALFRFLFSNFLAMASLLLIRSVTIR